MTEGGWVIEEQASQVCEPLYWGGTHDWTKDNLKAVRFSRKEDAEIMAEYLGFMEDQTYKHRVAYHEWG
jgi:hypothetical protein